MALKYVSQSVLAREIDDVTCSLSEPVTILSASPHRLLESSKLRIAQGSNNVVVVALKLSEGTFEIPASLEGESGRQGQSICQKWDCTSSMAPDHFLIGVAKPRALEHYVGDCACSVEWILDHRQRHITQGRIFS